MIEGIRLRGQLRPVWEKSKIFMFCKKSGYTKKNQGLKKILNIYGGHSLSFYFCIQTLFFQTPSHMIYDEV